MKKLISIIIPAYNEEDVISELTSQLVILMDSYSKYRFETIIVENGSYDNTLNLLLKARKKDSRIKVLELSKNVGCDGGIVAGLTFARGDAAIVMMADLQDSPKVIPKFVRKWEEGFDVVYGIIRSRRHTKLSRKIGTFIFYKLMNFLSHKMLPENVSDFRLMDRSVYQIVAKMPEHNKFFRGLVTWSGFKQTGITIDRPKRYAGSSKAYFFTVLNVALNGVMSFSHLPLRLAWVFFIIIFILGFVPLFYQDVYVLFSVMFFILAILFLFLAIQGEYNMRIFDEVRNRPHFIVKKTYGIS